MAIEINCGTCGKRYRVLDSLAGKKARCKGCGGVMLVPAGATGDPLDGLDLDGFAFEPAQPAMSAPPQIRTQPPQRAPRLAGSALKVSRPVLFAALGGLVVSAIGVIAIFYPHLFTSSERDPAVLMPDGPPTVREAQLEGPAKAEVARSLAEARRGFTTRLVRKTSATEPVPVPPKGMFDLVKYTSPAGELSAYVSVAPADGRKRPAIIWLIGGFDNGIGEAAWEPADPENDQSARAFREAGIIMMYPSLRGGNDNPGHREHFFGEVDDVLAAAEYLARQPFVDPERIYLGGHSTGATLALLVVESSARFRAAFCFGPVSDPMGYGLTRVPFDIRNPGEQELRAPGRWLSAIRTPTFVFEGTGSPGNIDELREMARETANPLVQFHPITRGDHFSILAPLTRVAAGKILADTGDAAEMSFGPRDLTMPRRK